MSYSVNPHHPAHLLLIQTNLVATFADEEREDLHSSPLRSFIAGQSPLDSPRDRFFFDLYSKGWIDSTGQCLANQWPSLTLFGKEEQDYLKELLEKPQAIKCTLDDVTLFSAHITLNHLFYHLIQFRLTFKDLPNFPTIFLV